MQKHIDQLNTEAPRNEAPRARALAQLRAWIGDGEFPVGQPIPAERVLAERLGVNRSTLRRALEVLTQEGRLRLHGPRTRIVAEARSHGDTLMRNTVLVLTADSDQPIPGHNAGGWIEYIVQGAIQEVRARGMHAMAVHPSLLSDQGFDQLATANPFGVVIPEMLGAPELVAQWAAQLAQRHVPVVLYGDDEELAPYDRVTSDHAQGSYLVTRWLLQQGRRRVMNLWMRPPQYYWMRGRREGFTRATQDFGVPAFILQTASSDRSVVGAPSTEQDVRLLAGYLGEYLCSDDPIDAIVGPSDGETPLIAQAVRLCGKTPNVDVLIAGYDNYWRDVVAVNKDAVAPVVTVDKRNREIGAELVRTLMQRVEGSLGPDPVCRVVAPELVEIHKE